MKLGIDIGSTTIKCALLNEKNELIYSTYKRHFCHISEKLLELIKGIKEKFDVKDCKLALSGSAGMGLCENLKLSFVQEVYATRVAANYYLDNPDCIIELGGEDAKIIFLTKGVEARMNGTCAGGTGAFIDQMSQLLNVNVEDLNDISKNYTKVYSIASRCGVFAKTDIQPLINQGAKKEDLAMSIYYAVVNQTIAGLAQGREVCGKVVYLGGPLTFNSQLRKAFDDTLKLTGICPENSLFYVALGTALMAEESYNLDDLEQRLSNIEITSNYESLEPLFECESEFDEFMERHKKNSVVISDSTNIKGDVACGIDVGSTTLKLVLINKDKEIVYSKYCSNQGNSLELVRQEILNIYKNNPEINIISSCVTGYGEEMIQNAFGVDKGIVETIAHFTAAKFFKPNVDFIIDIGGQDIKCFKIVNGVIDNLFLNEACSSGCGSFLQTFANALGYDTVEFSKLGLYAKKPVNLGSRCTVFMNSSIKQAQKDGASIEDISAGLSISVVKNALYKVIRITNPEELGQNIVVQGGTFYNNAVLRAFEKELNVNVIRPNISGLMGAFGCALYALDKAPENSTLITQEELKHFKVTTKNITCGLCTNKCQLTVNHFENGNKFITGNRCDRPCKKKSIENMNIYNYKRQLLEEYVSKNGRRGKIGLPMALNMYELYPFWHTFFTELGFEVVSSGKSTLSALHRAQNNISSDTVCFPAKMVHAHIDNLLQTDVPVIFYPCMTYNMKDESADNCFNCPVVAYYPEVISTNTKGIDKVTLITDFIGIHHKKDFPRQMHQILKKYFKGITTREIVKATKSAYAKYDEFIEKVKAKGSEIIDCAIKENKQVIVLAGRPYHVDPIINHGIDKLISSYGSYVISEDSINYDFNHSDLRVLNQWTYHSRLYSAAHFIKDYENMNLIQLVSFGCGVDSITTDEVREILEGHGKIYTQLKIDEITNLGAVKIRLRSLMEAIKQKKEEK